MPCEERPEDLAALLDSFDASTPHDEHVADLAREIFDLTRGLHQLPAERADLLAAGARLCNVGLVDGVKKHHRRGRDMILEHAGDEPSVEAKLIALMARFHRKRLKLDEDPLWATLSPAERDIALKLCALVRIADGLDYTQDQKMAIADFEQTLQSSALLVESLGGNGAPNIERAGANADLWNSLFPVPLEIEDASAHLKAQKRPVLMGPDDTMAEGGRKVLLHHLQQCLSHKAGTLEGEHIEELHDMRVATRRMRAAFRVFADYMPREPMGAFLDELRWVAGALGRVRDLDVFLAFLEKYARAAPEEDQAALNRLLGHRRRERTQLRKRMEEALNSDRFESFASGFTAFLSDAANLTPADDAACPTVRECGPAVISKGLKRAAKHRKTAPFADAAELHELRIRCKRLRYAAEFFDPSFDGAFKTLIKQCVKIQDALGNVHDADVYAEFLEDYSDRLLSEGGKEAERAVIERLLDDLAKWRQDNLAGFWAVWPKVAGKKKSIAKWRALLASLNQANG